MAVWGVLKNLWPNQFKNIDEQDGAKVWRSNLDGFTPDEMAAGLRVLRLMDSRFMPNAPACAKIIREAVRANLSRTTEKKAPETCPFWRSASSMWMVYNLAMVLNQKHDIGRDEAILCGDLSKIVSREYRAVWEDEELKTDEVFGGLAHDMGNRLVKDWNKICHIETHLDTIAKVTAVSKRT